MSPSQRGLLLHRVGDLIARDAKRLAEFEVRDNGKLMAEMFGQCEYLLQWHYYFGGLADKIQGAVVPLDKKGYFNFTRHEPLGVLPKAHRNRHLARRLKDFAACREGHGLG